MGGGGGDGGAEGHQDRGQGRRDTLPLPEVWDGLPQCQGIHEAREQGSRPSLPQVIRFSLFFGDEETARTLRKVMSGGLVRPSVTHDDFLRQLHNESLPCFLALDELFLLELLDYPAYGWARIARKLWKLLLLYGSPIFEDRLNDRTLLLG